MEKSAQIPNLPHSLDMSSTISQAGRIDDLELAQDMAIAMDPYMEQAIWARGIAKELSQDPDTTFRRSGRNKELYNQLGAVLAVRENLTYGYTQNEAHGLKNIPKSVEDMVARSHSDYVWKKTGAASYHDIPERDRERITKGSIGYLALKVASVFEEQAEFAYSNEFMKKMLRDNIAAYETVLTQEDQQLFAEVPKEDSDQLSGVQSEAKGTIKSHQGKELQIINSYYDDDELTRISDRQRELIEVQRMKTTIVELGNALGAYSIDNLDREDVVRAVRAIRAY